jgi:RNA polymerase sigma-70 factor (ECF subfamily)
VELIDLLVLTMTTASQAFSRDQKQIQLQHALEKMPPEQRDALRMRYIEGLPSKQIAERLGKSDGAVRVMLSRALGRLQQMLAPDQSF